MAVISARMSKINIANIGFFVYPPGSSYGPYEAGTSELVWIAEGQAVLETGGASHPLPPHSVVLTAAGETNRYRWDPTRATRHGIVAFTAAVDLAAGPRIRRLGPDDVVLPLLEHLRWLELERPADWEEMAAEAFAYALRAFLSGASGGRGPRGEDLPLAIERSIAAVRERWESGEQWSAVPLAELAAAAGVTPEHLCRLYKEELGCGPVTALRLVRLRRGVDLLTRSNMSIAEIANEVGFRDQFHFSKSFKQTFGVPPSALRNTPMPAIELPQPTKRIWAYL